MTNSAWISIEQFCTSHQVESSFVYALGQEGLLVITEVDSITCLSADQLAAAEKYIRLHAELGINVEGIEAISHLLERVEEMQQEIHRLRNQINAINRIKEDSF